MDSCPRALDRPEYKIDCIVNWQFINMTNMNLYTTYIHIYMYISKNNPEAKFHIYLNLRQDDRYNMLRF